MTQHHQVQARLAAAARLLRCRGGGAGRRQVSVRGILTEGPPLLLLLPLLLLRFRLLRRVADGQALHAACQARRRVAAACRRCWRRHLLPLLLLLLLLLLQRLVRRWALLLLGSQHCIVGRGRVKRKALHAARLGRCRRLGH